jgi:hypothetical protein
MADKKYISLEEILGKDNEELTAVKQGEFESEKLGLIPFSAVEHSEYKQAKKDCIKQVPNGTGGMDAELDDDKLMIRLIITAVEKDSRSSFTFADKQLLNKLDVATADAAVAKLLSPGEIYNMAVDIQNLSGFGAKKKKEDSEAVKNS